MLWLNVSKGVPGDASTKFIESILDSAPDLTKMVINSSHIILRWNYCIPIKISQKFIHIHDSFDINYNSNSNFGKTDIIIVHFQQVISLSQEYVLLLFKLMSNVKLWIPLFDTKLYLAIWSNFNFTTYFPKCQGLDSFIRKSVWQSLADKSPWGTTSGVKNTGGSELGTIQHSH